mmetsp:Transcript_13893/g.40554  ORF Transcript_13893/g.40554 Transcript_13893/m.40554 type:complete len:244 (+) Transcript_13893:152-883(+)
MVAGGCAQQAPQRQQGRVVAGRGTRPPALPGALGAAGGAPDCPSAAHGLPPADAGAGRLRPRPLGAREAVFAPLHMQRRDRCTALRSWQPALGRDWRHLLGQDGAYHILLAGCRRPGLLGYQAGGGPSRLCEQCAGLAVAELASGRAVVLRPGLLVVHGWLHGRQQLEQVEAEGLCRSLECQADCMGSRDGLDLLAHEGEGPCASRPSGVSGPEASTHDCVPVQGSNQLLGCDDCAAPLRAAL